MLIRFIGEPNDEENIPLREAGFTYFSSLCIAIITTMPTVVVAESKRNISTLKVELGYRF
jgi:hypothetical protein|tara:strand:+ start:970 stop:1149 length:180 start_codon:yes stop_codon:yes gene_type:complete